MEQAAGTSHISDDPAPTFDATYDGGSNLQRAFYEAADMIPRMKWREFARTALKLLDKEVERYPDNNMKTDGKYDMLCAWRERQKEKTGRETTADEFFDILVPFLAENKLGSSIGGGKLRHAFYDATGLIPENEWEEFARRALKSDENEIENDCHSFMTAETKYKMLCAWRKRQKQKTGKETTAEEFFAVIVPILAEKRLEMIWGTGKLRRAFYQAMKLIPHYEWNEFTCRVFKADKNEVEKYRYNIMTTEDKYDMLCAWGKRQEEKTGRETTVEEFLDLFVGFLAEKKIAISTDLGCRCLQKSFYDATELIPDKEWNEFARRALKSDKNEVESYRHNVMRTAAKYDMLCAWRQRQERKTDKETTKENFFDILVSFLTEKGLSMSIVQNFNGDIKTKIFNKVVNGHDSSLQIEGSAESCDSDASPSRQCDFYSVTLETPIGHEGGTLIVGKCSLSIIPRGSFYEIQTFTLSVSMYLQNLDFPKNQFPVSPLIDFRSNGELQILSVVKASTIIECKNLKNCINIYEVSENLNEYTWSTYESKVKIEDGLIEFSVDHSGSFIATVSLQNWLADQINLVHALLYKGDSFLSIFCETIQKSLLKEQIDMLEKRGYKVVHDDKFKMNTAEGTVQSIEIKSLHPDHYFFSPATKYLSPTILEKYDYFVKFTFLLRVQKTTSKVKFQYIVGEKLDVFSIPLTVPLSIGDSRRQNTEAIGTSVDGHDNFQEKKVEEKGIDAGNKSVDNQGCVMDNLQRIKDEQNNRSEEGTSVDPPRDLGATLISGDGSNISFQHCNINVLARTGTQSSGSTNDETKTSRDVDLSEKKPKIPSIFGLLLSLISLLADLLA